jgi:hypothetical protein
MSSQDSIDYTGLWIGISIGGIFLIIFSILLFFYLRYRKRQKVKEHRKHIAQKANVATKFVKDLSMKIQADLNNYDMNNSNNKSNNRLMDEIAKRSEEEKATFNVFSQIIRKNFDPDRPIKNPQSNRSQKSQRKSVNNNDINKIELIIQEEGHGSTKQHEAVNRPDKDSNNDSRNINSFIKSYNVKQVLCYTNEHASEPGDSLYKENLKELQKEYYEIKKEEYLAREREEEIEQEYNNLFGKKDRSTADDDEKQSQASQDKDDLDDCKVVSEYGDGDVKQINKFDANIKLAIMNNAVMTDFSHGSEDMPEIYKHE